MSTFTLRKGREFGEIISDTFGYVRKYFSSLAKGLVLYSLPMIIFSGILIGSGVGDSISMAEAGDNAAMGDVASMGLKMLAGVVLLMLTLVVIIQITFKHINLIDSGIAPEEISMSMLLEDFFRNFFGLIGLSIVIGFATILGFIFFILPGIYIATKLSLAPAIFIIDEEDFGDALSRSWETTNGYWWFTFGTSFVMSIIINLISNIAIVPLYIIMIVVVFSSGEPDMELFSTLFSVFYALMMIVIGLLYCFPLVSQAMVYFTVYESKSGASLKERIDALAQNNFQE